MGEDEVDMIQCDNKNCKIIWFHQKCVRIKQIPFPNGIGIFLNAKNLHILSLHIFHFYALRKCQKTNRFSDVFRESL